MAISRIDLRPSITQARRGCVQIATDASEYHPTYSWSEASEGK